MSQENNSQDPAAQAAPASDNSAQAGQTNPASDTNQTPGGDDKGKEGEVEMVSIPVAEHNDLKRDAGRYKSRNTPGGRTKRVSRTAAKPVEGDEAIQARDAEIGDLTKKNMVLEAKDGIRELFDNEDFKKLPAALKTAVMKNPLGFANNESDTVNDIVCDIQDFLDDAVTELGNNTNPAPSADPAPAPGGDNQTPPAQPSGPTSQGGDPTKGTENLTGRAKSSQIIANLFKK
jgi:hypothetical protein